MVASIHPFQAHNMKYIQKQLFKMLIPTVFIPAPRIILCDRINSVPECFIDGLALGVDVILIFT